jgi:transcriptional regulator with XRE-family HTH domain
MSVGNQEVSGEVFRRKREELGLSVRDLEGRTGVSRSTISKLETGKSLPDGANLLRLMKFFNLSIEDIALSP